MDAAGKPARNPLTVSVSDATPSELEAQAQHHITNAALTLLEEFLKDTDANNAVVAHFGEPAVMALVDTKGNATFGVLTIMHLCELDRGRQLVYYRSYERSVPGNVQPHNGYGVIDTSFRGLYTYSVQDHLGNNPNVLRTVLYRLTDLQQRTLLAIAEERRQLGPDLP